VEQAFAANSARAKATRKAAPKSNQWENLEAWDVESESGRSVHEEDSPAARFQEVSSTKDHTAPQSTTQHHSAPHSTTQHHKSSFVISRNYDDSTNLFMTQNDVVAQP
jgi:hypothetical protein